MKDFFTFLETEFSILLFHIPTRLLGLFTAVDRLLENWTEIKYYFF
jgi:hypothetical protein